MKKLNDKLDLLYIPNSSSTTLNEHVDLEQAGAQLMCISCQIRKHYKNFALKPHKFDVKQKINRTKESSIDSVPETIIDNPTRARLNQTNQFLNAGLQSTTNQLNSNDSVCNQCYLYWKKYGGYKTVQSDAYLNTCNFFNK